MIIEIDQDKNPVLNFWTLNLQASKKNELWTATSSFDSLQ